MWPSPGGMLKSVLVISSINFVFIGSKKDVKGHVNKYVFFSLMQFFHVLVTCQIEATFKERNLAAAEQAW